MRYGALAVVCVAAAVAIAVVVGNRAGSSPTTAVPGTVQPFGPTALSGPALKAAVMTLNQPFYWIGPASGDTYELTRTKTGNVFVRYLPPGVKAGTHEGEYLVIATYPYKGALAALKASNVGKPLKIPGGKGEIAFVQWGKRTNVHVAFPHVKYQIEVYDPSAKAARELVTSGRLKPVP